MNHQVILKRPQIFRTAFGSALKGEEFWDVFF